MFHEWLIDMFISKTIQTNENNSQKHEKAWARFNCKEKACHDAFLKWKTGEPQESTPTFLR